MKDNVRLSFVCIIYKLERTRNTHEDYEYINN